MRPILLCLTLLAGTVEAQGYDLKGDALGTSLEDWRAKHRHVSEEYQGRKTYAPMCSDTSPKNSFIQPQKPGVGEVICEMYYPYQRKKVTIANNEASVRYYFNTASDGHEAGNGLRLILASFDSGSYEKMKAALLAKWGDPDQAQVETLQNAYGATFEGEQLIWADSGDQMRLSQYSGSLSKSSLMLIDTALSEEASNRTAKVPNADLDDL